MRDAETRQKQSEFKCARLKKQVAATHSKTKATKPAGRRRYKSQRRPPKKKKQAAATNSKATSKARGLNAATTSKMAASAHSGSGRRKTSGEMFARRRPKIGGRWH